MINSILKTDYTLSKWFSKTEDRVVPGTVFLFLNKMVFVWTSVVLVIMSFLKDHLSTEIWVLIVVSGALMIMYGFQKRIENYVINLNLKKNYTKQLKNQIKKDRILGLLFFCCSFFMIFFMVILFH